MAAGIEVANSEGLDSIEKKGGNHGDISTRFIHDANKTVEVEIDGEVHIG